MKQKCHQRNKKNAEVLYHTDLETREKFQLSLKKVKETQEGKYDIEKHGQKDHGKVASTSEPVIGSKVCQKRKGYRCGSLAAVNSKQKRKAKVKSPKTIQKPIEKPKGVHKQVSDHTLAVCREG